MRRVPALILLAVFSFPLVAPAFAANADSPLPACCRRDGKHRCAMLSGYRETRSPAISAIQSQCPYYPATTSTPASEGNAAILKTRQAIYASVPGEPAFAALMDVQYRADLCRAHQKRGPPTQLP